MKRIFFLEGNKDGTVGGSYYLMYDLVLSLDRSKYQPIVGFHVDNFLVEDLRQKGVEVFILPYPKPFSFNLSYLNTILSPVKRVVNFFKRFIFPAFEYAKFLKEHKIDLVNLNNSINRNFYWMLAAKIAGVKCMTHEMGINKQFLFWARYFGKRLESVICLSHVIHQNMIDKGVGFDNVEVVHCGIDIDRYKINETKEDILKKHSLTEKNKIIGVVGNLKKWKGQETIVRATGLLKESFKDIKCILVGDCAEWDLGYKSRLENIIRDLDISENIIFAGFQRNAIDYMNAMDVVVHTSIEPEPFGIVTLEAMLLGRPLVSTNIGGPTEVVKHGETGILVTPGRHEILAQALTELLSDAPKAAEMGAAGKKRLLDHFTLQKAVGKTTKIYDRIFS